MTERFDTSPAASNAEQFSEQDYRAKLLKEVGEPRLPNGTTPETVKGWQLLTTRKVAAIFALNNPEWKMPEDVHAALHKREGGTAHDEKDLAYDRLLGINARPSEFLLKRKPINEQQIAKSLKEVDAHNTTEVSLFCDWKRDVLKNPVDYRYDEYVKRVAEELAQRAMAGLPNPELEQAKTYLMKNLDMHCQMVSSRTYRVSQQKIYAPNDANDEALAAHESELCSHIAWLKILFPGEDWNKYAVAHRTFNPRGTMTTVWKGGDSAQRLGKTSIDLAFILPILAAKKVEVPAEGGLILDGRRIGAKAADAVHPISEETHDRIDDVL